MLAGNSPKLEGLLKDDLAVFNKLVRDQNVPAVIVRAKPAGGVED
jgi:hypothetical protein